MEPQSGPPGASEADQVDLNSIFSLRQPKDAKAGLSSGLKSVGKGIVAGAVGLVAAPAIGAQQQGLAGFAKGAGAGILGAVVLPVAGAVVGATQVVRGMAATPAAMRATAEGKCWDEVGRQWVLEPSQALVAQDEQARARREAAAARTAGASSAPGAAGGPGGEVDYYALLGVSRTADAAEIRRQYYLQARRLHPDKNAGDPEAAQRFQALGQAYQVLSSPERRARYDAHGARGLDVDFVDGGEFFTALFGSDAFEDLVGELLLATAARGGAAEQGPAAAAAAAVRAAQGSREAGLQARLKQRLERWVQGDRAGFTLAAEEEARRLAKASFGDVMLRTVARCYSSAAAVHLGGVFEGGLAALRARGTAIKSQWAAASLAVRVYQAQQRLARLPAEDGAASAEAAAAAAAERAALEESSLPLMLEAMWAANALDIQSTLRHVCRAVLGDAAASKEAKRARAEGLQELGRVLRAAALAQSEAEERRGGEMDAKRRMEQAMMAVMERRGGVAGAAEDEEL